VGADLPRTVTRGSDGLAVTTQRVDAELAPCWRSSADDGARAVAYVCGFVTVARLGGEGVNVQLPQVDALWLAELGARAALELRASRRLAVRLRVDAAAPLVRATVTLDREAVWEASWVRAAAGVSLVVRFR
jgi:hypothetical protein